MSANSPNLFILGAPKCGTTTLAAWLAQHPQVYFSPEKEPRHFYAPYGELISRESYEALFEQAPADAKYLGEASVWYLFGGTAVPKILEYNPEARFIVCLRNPVKMAPSLHAQMLYTGKELISNFEDAWKASDQRYAGEHIGIFGFDHQGDPACMAYKQACMLGQQVEILLQQIDKERVLFVLLEDLSANPEETWDQIQDFLGLAHFAGFPLRAHNQAKRRKFLGLQRFTLFAENLKRRLGIKKRFGILAIFNRRNVAKEKYPPPPKELQKSMQQTFRDDILKLSNLVNRNLSNWLS